MLLLDKGYFDYDYEKTNIPVRMATWEETVKSDEEVDSILRTFGIGVNRSEPETAEEIQSYVLKQLEDK